MGDPPIVQERDEARAIANALMRECVSINAGGAYLNLGREGTSALAAAWLAAETRAARLDRACEVGA